jgi:hypothetical protein
MKIYSSRLVFCSAMKIDLSGCNTQQVWTAAVVDEASRRDNNLTLSERWPNDFNSNTLDCVCVFVSVCVLEIDKEGG